VTVGLSNRVSSSATLTRCRRVTELTDGSKWRIWPGDLATTLGWTSEVEIEVVPIEDEFCSHILIDQSGGSKVRAIEASNDWPIDKLRKALRRGSYRFSAVRNKT
jgi:hypothetical protein